MNLSLHYKTKQFFFVLIKLSIVVGAFYFIYKKLTNNDSLDFAIFIQFLENHSIFSTKSFIFIIILSIFNWFFEISKWRLLVSSIKKISFINALEQSLGSLTASLFTPNRIGEYGAKAIYFNKPLRKRILLLNLIGNLMQMSITLIIGTIGVSLLINQYSIGVDYYKASAIPISIVVLIAIFIFALTQKKYKIENVSFENIKQFIKNLPISFTLLGFFYSLIRYLIFSFQFYFLLQLLGVDISYLNAMIVISTMYLLTSLIPSIFIFDVIIKGSVAVYLFSLLGIDELTVLCVVTLMWILNFVIPSLFGSFYVLNFKFPEDDN